MDKILKTNFLKYIEVPIVILLLLFAESVNVPFIRPTIINVFSYGAIFILIAVRINKFAYFATRDPFLIALVGLAVVSVYWSASPANTMQEARALVRSLFFSIYLAMRYAPQEQIKLLSRVTGIALIISLIGCLFIPFYGKATDPENFGAWIGIFNHKQIFGRFLAFSASIYIANLLAYKKNRPRNILFILIIFGLVLFSRSRTSLMSFCVILLLIPFYFLVKQKTTRSLFTLIFLFIASITSILIFSNLEGIVVDFLGKNLEFNGRTPIWEMIIEQGVQHNYFLGYGYNAFWTTSESTHILMNSWASGQENFVSGQDIFHSHNGFIDLFIQLGILGVIVFTLNLIQVFWRIIYLLATTRNIEYFWMFLFMLVYLIFNMFEGQTLLSTSNILWLTFGYISISSSVDYKQIRQELIYKKNDKFYFNDMHNLRET